MQLTLLFYYFFYCNIAILYCPCVKSEIARWYWNPLLPVFYFLMDQLKKWAINKSSSNFDKLLNIYLKVQVTTLEAKALNCLNSCLCQCSFVPLFPLNRPDWFYPKHSHHFAWQVFNHVMKTGGDNCILTSNVLNFETEELLVGSKVCPGIIMSLLKNVSTVSRNQKNKTLRPTMTTTTTTT